MSARTVTLWMLLRGGARVCVGLYTPAEADRHVRAWVSAANATAGRVRYEECGGGLSVEEFDQEVARLRKIGAGVSAFNTPCDDRPGETLTTLVVSIRDVSAMYTEDFLDAQ